MLITFSTSPPVHKTIQPAMNSALRSKATARLPKLPPEILAKALLDLAEWSKDAEQVIESLTTSADEAIATFKRKLNGIKRRTRFYHRSSASHFASELDSLLDLLRKPGLDPQETLKALVSFFEADSKLMEMADDSNGSMGYVFKHSATDLLVEVAQKVTDQNLLIKTFKKLYTSNDYGVRDAIADRAGEFLTPESLESLYDFYRSSNEENPQSRILTEALAAQLKNPEQFEAELRKVSDHYYAANLCELAEVYQSAGRHRDLATHFDEWLGIVRACDLDKLRDIAVATYLTIGEPVKAKDLRVSQFLESPSVTRLKTLSDFTDEAERKALLKKASATIVSEKTLSQSSLRFLQETDQYLLANEFLLSRHDQLNGDFYDFLATAAKSFEGKDYPLAASLIWRTLADSILARAYLKAYPHAARYLANLHGLAPKIDSWNNHPNHTSYLQALHKNHSRKSSFWKLVADDIQQEAKS